MVSNEPCLWDPGLLRNFNIGVFFLDSVFSDVVSNESQRHATTREDLRTKSVAEMSFQNLSSSDLQRGRRRGRTTTGLRAFLPTTAHADTLEPAGVCQVSAIC